MGPPLFCALAGRRTQIRRCAEKAPGLSHFGKSGGFAVALKGAERLVGGAYALPTEPNSSIFSLTVALIASVPGANSLRGSKPFPC